MIPFLIGPFPSVVEARRSHNLGSAITLASSHTQLEQSPFHRLKVYVFYSDSALETSLCYARSTLAKLSITN